MLKCPQCGITHPIKVNKINGLPQKNQSEFCSESCWHKWYRSSGLKPKQEYKPNPRASRAKREHWCMYCGKRSMKVIDKRDPNKFCSTACRDLNSKRVSREIALLRCIGQSAYTRKKDRERTIKATAINRLIASLRPILWIKCVCATCGTAIPQTQKNGRPLKHCAMCAGIARNISKRASKRKRRAAKSDRTPIWFGELDLFVWQEASDLVRKRRESTGMEWDADHILPLKCRTVSGLHVWNNCQVIPAILNNKKRNKLIIQTSNEWISEL